MSDRNRIFIHTPLVNRFLRGCAALFLALAAVAGSAGSAEAAGSEAAGADGGCVAAPGVRALREYPGVYNFYYENDLFAGSDDNYTNGMRVSWVSANLRDYVHDPCLPLWVRRLNRLAEAWRPGGYDSRNMVVTLGQAIYTPNDLRRRDLIPEDRPYAGWLYLGLAYNARTARHMETTEIDLGVVGPAALAKQAQDLVHDVRGFERFQGWGNQLHNELGIQIVRERKDKVYISPNLGPNLGGPQFDVITHYGVSLGNVKTYLNAGIELRLGQLPDDFGTAAIRPAADSNAPLTGDGARRLSRPGLHVFLALDARAVARDIFLDGNTFGSSHRVSKKPLVGDAALGLAWQWDGGKLSYAQYVRSKEFDGQPRRHGYGSLTLSLEY